MTARNPLVLVSGAIAELPAGDTVIGAVASAPAFATVEKDLGSIARRAGRFTITSSGLTAGKPVKIWQAVGPYTGKGTREDECEMDEVVATGIVLNATTITAYWSSATRVRGNRKLNYLIGA